MSEDLFKKVRKIEIKTRRISSQIFSGHYQSAFKGRGMAFSEVREYQYGDDIRNIDWNVTARFNHPYIKVFEEERELTNMILIDVSASNLFGTKLQFKSETIVEIAAVLAFSAIQNNDKVGVIFFSDKVEKFIPPKKGRKHILRIIRELIDFKADNTKTDISEALKYLNNTIKKTCTAFIISDFMDHSFKKSLQIASNKHDIVGINIFDERETDLPKMGLVRMFDPEIQSNILIDTNLKKIRNAHNLWWRNHFQIVRKIFNTSGIDFISIAANKDYVPVLLELFRKRESRF
jgi:uncharacterized protein (DUF58 family)